MVNNQEYIDMEEVFKDLKNYEQSYQISAQGRVFSKRRLDGNRIIYGRELVPRITKDGYMKVTLCKDGIQKSYFIHRLVALNFLSNPNNFPQVNHKDGNKYNNDVSNLEWCTKRENQNHAVQHLLMQHGEARPSSKLTEKDVLEIYKMKGVLTGAEIGRKYGVSKNTINCILRGDKWSYLYRQYFKCETTENIGQSAAKL